MLTLAPGAEYQLEPGHNYIVRSVIYGLKLKLQIHTGPKQRLFVYKFTLTSSKNKGGMDARDAHAVVLTALLGVVSQLSEEILGS